MKRSYTERLSNGLKNLKEGILNYLHPLTLLQEIWETWWELWSDPNTRRVRESTRGPAVLFKAWTGWERQSSLEIFGSSIRTLRYILRRKSWYILPTPTAVWISTPRCKRFIPLTCRKWRHLSLSNCGLRSVCISFQQMTYFVTHWQTRAVHTLFVGSQSRKDAALNNVPLQTMRRIGMIYMEQKTQ